MMTDLIYGKTRKAVVNRFGSIQEETMRLKMVIDGLQDFVIPNQVQMEIVAKFAVPDPGIFWRLQVVSQMAGYQLFTQKLRDIYDIYLDTVNQRLFSAGYTCRRRILQAGMSIIVTKPNKPEGPFHHRQKLEVALPAALPPARWPESAARELVLQLSSQQQLAPLFKIQLTRIVRVLQRHGQVMAELKLDKVSLIANDEEQIYHELEVELLPSVPGQIMADLIDCFQNEWYLPAEPRSKFQRYLELLE